MNMTQFVNAFFILALLTPLVGSAQKATDRMYAMKGYSSAVHKLEAKSTKSTEDLIKIANGYRLNHDTQNAAIWYKQVIDQSEDPMNLLYYAQALQSNGNSMEAKRYFLLFDQKVSESQNDQRGKRLAEAIDRMNEMSATGKIVIENVSTINTRFHEFSPVYYNDGLLFVSNRDIDEKDDYKDKWMDSKFLNLYFSELSKEGNFETPKEYSTHLNSDYHEGPSCFNHSGNQIFFSQNQNKKGRRINNKAGIMKNDIYSSRKEGNTWSTPEKLPFNTAEFEEVHPTLSIDGQFLLFASDRAGGFGGMDIYVSKRKNGVWQSPENLGEKVNTPGNEIFPFLQADNTLYFSSNGWGGLGGLDIFKIKIAEQTAVEEAQNLGQPLNSTMDDFGYISNLLGTEGYFSSDRDEGKGKDDIYKFSTKKKGEKEFLDLKDICFSDRSNGKRLEAVRLKVKAFEGHEPAPSALKFYGLERKGNFKPAYLLGADTPAAIANDALVAGPSGDLSVQLVSGKKYLFEAKKEGYADFASEIDLTKNLEALDNGCFLLGSLESMKVTISGKVIDQYSKLPIANASIDIIEPCLNISKTIITDANGRYTWSNAECECELKIVGSKAEYHSNSETTGSIAEACARGGMININLDLTEKNVQSASSPAVSSPARQNTKAINSNFARPNAEVIEVGSTLELKNIFYDFNKSYIRKTASSDLNQLAKLMKKYPSMVIELGSYTDARGTIRYNRKLSQRRADAAVRFLIKKGIARERLVAKGYGETGLRNTCGDNSDCTEEQHQLNRRTEISILKLDEIVDVKYIDNWPVIVR